MECDVINTTKDAKLVIVLIYMDEPKWEIWKMIKHIKSTSHELVSLRLGKKIVNGKDQIRGKFFFFFYLEKKFIILHFNEGPKN